MTLPDISATTPKVSLFEFPSAGQELITACVQQTEKFSGIAETKVGFMKMNQERADNTIKFTPCVVRNATGVRLSLRSFTGQPAGDYPAPALIEPGECASFLAPGEAGTFTCEVQVFEGPFAGWKAPSGAQLGPGVPPKDVSIPTFNLKYPVAGAINYCDKIKLINQYKGYLEEKGYLDTFGFVNDDTGYDVVTSSNPNRDGGSGTWEIVRNDLTNGSGPVMYGDKIKLINQYNPAKGYLDTFGIVNDDTGYGVVTSSNPNRDGGSGTWEIVRNDLTNGSGPVMYGDKIKLINQYNPAKGYLDTFGIVNDDTGYGVVTSSNPNRDGGSGTWQLIPNFPNPGNSSATPSTASAFVQDMKAPNELFETTLTWTTTNGQALPVSQFILTQSVA